MTQAFNLSQLANNLNSSGQLDATDGLVNAVPVGNGGTGATTDTGARSNLSAAKSGSNSDITQLTGLTTALTVGQGGTGATSISSGSLVKGNGTSAFSAASASDIVSAIGSTYVSNATYASSAGSAGNGGVTSVNAKTGAVQSVITSLTNKNATSTVVDFSGIPSWAKRITVMLSGVSSNGTSDFICQLGTSGGFVSSGYVSQSVYIYANPTVDNITSGFGLTGANVAAESVTGQLILSNQTGNTWVGSAMFARSGGVYPQIGMGGVALAGVVTSIRVTTLNGTDTFDAGTINVMYE